MIMQVKSGSKLEKVGLIGLGMVGVYMLLSTVEWATSDEPSPVMEQQIIIDELKQKSEQLEQQYEDLQQQIRGNL